jgi:acetolactate synthase-1/2/3 large subunit
MKNAAQVLVDALIAQGVTTAFGVPGESYLAVLDALHAAPIRLVANRHEGGAAFMAEAWGKLTGGPGIAFVTRGPGAANAAIGVHAAQQSATPMILFIGQAPLTMRDRRAFQEVDYRAVFGDLAKWVAEVETPDRMAELVGRAFAVAQSGRPGPVVLALPEDVLTAPAPTPAGPRVTVPRPGPDAAALAAIRDRLAAARRPLVVAGGGGWTPRGRAALRAFSEANRLPVLAEFRRLDILDQDSPSYAGDLGLAKGPAICRLVESADLILALGAEFGEIATDGYRLLAPPAPGPALIHVHPDPDEIGRVYAAALPVVADPDAAARALEGLLLPEAPWAERTAAARADWLDRTPAPQPGDLDLGAVYAHLDAVLPEDAIGTNGAGNFATWPTRHLTWRGARRLIAPQSGAMGYGLPAAIAAKLAHPERRVICFTGDGDFQMTATELGTALQAGAQPIVLLLNNASYGTIRMHQERDYPDRVTFTDIVNPDFPALARAYGFHGERVTRTEEFAAAFARAEAAPAGALIELVVPVEAISPQRSLSQIRGTGARHAPA